jgi:5-methyltetrahydropteroyltriglutamate--homocysteine methyltransferase
MARDILTTIIGSYPRPDWLAPPAIAHADPTEQTLRDAIAVVLKTQELAGIDLLTDGELNRYDPSHPETNGAIDYFIRPLRNVRTEVTRSEERKFQEVPHLKFRSRTAGVVEGQLGEGTLNLLHDFHRSRALTARPLKFVITSPYMLERVLIDKHYKDKEALVGALADLLAGQVREIEAEVVQVNDEFITGAPQDGRWVADALNRIFDVVPHKSALHACFGNYNGQTVQHGSYRPVIDFINELHIDHMLVEMTRRNADDLAALKDIRPEIGIGIGVLDVKSTVVESPDDVARAIEHAERVIGPDRIKYVSPDCGLWMHKRSVADAKLQMLVRGRDLYLAKSRDDDA